MGQASTPSKHQKSSPPLRAAEFFAGIGLVRVALEQAGIDVVFANDIEPVKHRLYSANHSDEHFALADVRAVRGADIPEIDVATASFPCTDLSLAGNRAGLAGEESSMFWEFARILGELDTQRPAVVMLENVPSFATSRNGGDLTAALKALNDLGYGCDIFLLDASWFVPQSRPRLFIVGTSAIPNAPIDLPASPLRPDWLVRFITQNSGLSWCSTVTLEPQPVNDSLSTVVERLRPTDARWWNAEQKARFQSSLSSRHAERLDRMRRSKQKFWATAYRRTRTGKAVWEIRNDDLSGCLRTARGGSSKQALVEAGHGSWRVRWMTPREYARLQGADGYDLAGVSDSQALFGFGDAVCVPAVAWIARHCLRPMAELAKASSSRRSESKRAKAA